MCYDSNGPRSNEKADGRFRRVLGDGLAAEGGEDCHGYQTQGERRTCSRSISAIVFVLVLINILTSVMHDGKKSKIEKMLLKPLVTILYVCFLCSFVWCIMFYMFIT